MKRSVVIRALMAAVAAARVVSAAGPDDGAVARARALIDHEMTRTLA